MCSDPLPFNQQTNAYIVLDCIITFAWKRWTATLFHCSQIEVLSSLLSCARRTSDFLACMCNCFLRIYNNRQKLAHGALLCSSLAFVIVFFGFAYIMTDKIYLFTKFCTIIFKRQVNRTKPIFIGYIRCGTLYIARGNSNTTWEGRRRG